MHDTNELPERPRTLAWGDGSHESEELVDQFILSLAYGPDMSVRGSPVRWLLLFLRHPYSASILALEDSHKTEKARNSHTLELFCRVCNVDGYPLVNWSVVSITDWIDYTDRTSLGVVAPDRDGMSYAVQQWACAEYSHSTDPDNWAYMPAVG